MEQETCSRRGGKRREPPERNSSNFDAELNNKHAMEEEGSSKEDFISLNKNWIKDMYWGRR